MRLALALVIAVAPAAAIADEKPHPVPHVHGTAANPVTATGNGYKALDGKVWDLSGQTIEGFDLVVSREGIVIERGQSNVVIQNGKIRLKEPGTGHNLPEGIAVNDGSDITIKNVEVHNFQMVPNPPHYLNGDCFSGERKAVRVTITDTLADQCSDGGYDFKATHLRYDNATAQGVDYCFRVWGQASAGVITCKDWGKWTDSGAAVQVVAFEGGSFVVATLNLQAMPGKPQTVFDIRRPGAVLTVGECVGDLPVNDGLNRLIVYADGATPDNTQVKLGPSCVLKPGPGSAASAIEIKAPRPPPPPKPAVTDATPQGGEPEPAKTTVVSKILLPEVSGNGVIDIISPAKAAALGVPLHTKLLDQPTPVAGGYEYPVKN
jgi:hypothetical protein